MSFPVAGCVQLFQHKSIPLIWGENMLLQKVACSSRNPTSYSEPAAKRFRRNLCDKQAARQLTEQSYIPDDYLADEESVFESTEWKNLRSISSDSEWERLYDFSGSTVCESSEDDSDWKL